MALFAHFKAEPTEYILAYTNGRVFRQGTGRTFWYMPHRTSIALIPVSTTDMNFAFNETTSNFQAITLQGQFTYRITQPQIIAQQLDFTITARTNSEQFPQLAELLYYRVVARESGGAFELDDVRVERAVLMMRRAKVAKARKRLTVDRL